MEPNSNTDRIAAWRQGPSVVLLMLTLWAGTHPYRGIWHDAKTYTLMALDRIQPEIFGHDLFTVFGSQDAYTGFSPLYAQAIRMFGLLEANVILLVTAQALWLVSAYSFTRLLGRGLAAYLMLIAIVAMPPAYLAGLSYGESVLTPRLFAEALVLFSFVTLTRRRTVATFLLLAVAFAFHPLVALSGVAVAAIMLVWEDRRWAVVIGVVVVLVLTLAVLGVRPLDQLFRVVDEAWLSLIERRTPWVIPTLWETRYWGGLAADISLTTAAALLMHGRRRRLILSVVLTTIGGVIVSLIGGDLLKSPLIIQLQLWRADWLLHLMSYPALVLLMLRLRHRRPDGLAILSLHLTGWMLAPFLAGIYINATALALTFARSEGRASPLRRQARVILYGLAVSVAVGWLGLWGWVVVDAWQTAERTALEFLPKAQQFLVIRLLIVALAFLAIRSVTRRRLIGPAIAVIVAAPLVVINWDQHPYWEELMGTSADSSIQTLQAIIDPSAQVFWPDHASAVWILLRRASYVSTAQAVGMIFSHQTASEWARRMTAIESLQSDERIDVQYELNQCDDTAPEPGADALARVCRTATDLNYLMLPFDIPGLSKASWRAPRETPKLCIKDGKIEVYRRDVNFYLYDCKSLLAAAPSS